jgi:hypothetical protein
MPKMKKNEFISGDRRIRHPGRTISRILFLIRVSKGRLNRRDHLSRLPVTRQLMRSTRGKERRAAVCLPKQVMPLLDLAPPGGCLADALLQSPEVSYTAVSPLPREGRYVSVALSGGLLQPGSYPAGCSAECGLSSA